MNKHTLKLKKPLAFFDLETTGVNISKDRIVEISIAKAKLDGTVEIFTKRINPTVPIPLETSLIHGIYDTDIADAPTFYDLAPEIAQFLENCDLGGFYSNRFDIPLLMEEFLRVEETKTTLSDKVVSQKPLEINFSLQGRNLVDAQKIYHLMEPRTLSAAYKFYCNKTLENAHSAEADTIASFEVFIAQLEKYEGVTIKNEKGEDYEPVKNDMESLHELTSKNIVDFAQRMTFNKDGKVVFNFGKHSGKIVEEVLEKEPQFYDWIMNNDFPRDTKNKLKEIYDQNQLKRLQNKFAR